MSQEPVVRVNIPEWEARVAQDPKVGIYSLAYAHARQQGLEHEDAVRFGQMEAYGRVRSHSPQPESEHNRRWARVQLSTPLASLLEDRPAAPAPESVAPYSPLRPATPSIPSEAAAYDQLRLALESRANGRFASPTRVANPETVAASLLERAMELPPGPALSSADQLDLMTLLQQAEQRATNETPAAAPATAEVPPEKHAVDALPQRTPSGRRLAGGYAVTGGLGLLGLLGLAALTDPYSVKPAREPQEVTS